MSRSALAATVLLSLLVAGCEANQPPVSAPAPVARAQAPAPIDPQFAEAAAKIEAAKAKEAACAKIRETVLTGSSSEIRAGMATVLADTSADTRVREVARRYLRRYKGEDQLRELDISSLLSACTYL